jgi:hypothetical protein
VGKREAGLRLLRAVAGVRRPADRPHLLGPFTVATALPLGGSVELSRLVAGRPYRSVIVPESEA